jgi:hypothetical protein
MDASRGVKGEAFGGSEQYCVGNKEVLNFLAYLRHRVTNAASESINSKIQWVKYSARGLRNKRNFQTAVYFHCGGHQNSCLPHKPNPHMPLPHSISRALLRPLPPLGSICLPYGRGYPDATGKVAILRTIVANSRRVS